MAMLHMGPKHLTAVFLTVAFLIVYVVNRMPESVSRTLRYINNQGASASAGRRFDSNNSRNGSNSIERDIKRCFYLSFELHELDQFAIVNYVNRDTDKSYQTDIGDVLTNITENGVRNQSTDGAVFHCRCKRFVTRTGYSGRMGNQMFQIASLIGTAYMYDAIPVIPKTFPLNSYFNLPNIVDTKVNTISNLVRCNQNMSAVYYNCSKAFSGDANISMDGYLQSWKYFENAEEYIRRAFTLRSHYIERAAHFLNNVSIPGHQQVCIHVRRGDQVAKTSIKKGVVIAGVDYIQKAKRYFLDRYSNVQFLVVSDDKPWCAKHLNDVIISPLVDPGDEMALMMLCDHVIMTVGTYGWWGGWLSGGTTVYFKEFARPGSEFASQFSIEDFFPPNWIGIS